MKNIILKEIEYTILAVAPEYFEIIVDKLHVIIWFNMKKDGKE